MLSRYLNENALNGTIPSELVNLTTLSDLYVLFCLIRYCLRTLDCIVDISIDGDDEIKLD